jgi:CheY-like chemotaxis protein
LPARDARLVVDDNATNRHILEETLRSWKMAPVSASGAGQALGLLRRAHDAGAPYRMVVSDAHMPRSMDSAYPTNQARSGHPMIPRLLMLTSGDRPEDVSRCNELGIAGYLLKPVKPSDLLEAIEIALGIIVPKKECSEAASATAESSIRIAGAVGRGQSGQPAAGCRPVAGARAYGHGRQQRQASRDGQRAQQFD